MRSSSSARSTAIFNLGGFRGEDEENPIQLARRFRELAGFTDEENDSLAALARESTEQARADGGDGRPPRSTRRARRRTLRGEPRHRHARIRSRSIAYDVGRDRGARRGRGRARRASRPTSRSTLDVDEELFPPLTGHMADVVDGRVVLWISGAQLRGHPPARATSRRARPAPTSRSMLLRAKDRLSDDFADAPPDRELTRGERIAWDIYAIGRAERLGIDGPPPARALRLPAPARLHRRRRRRVRAVLERADDDLGRHPRDLQGDRRRRPRPLEGPGRPPPPEVAGDPADAQASGRRSSVRSWAEIVSSRSIVGFSARSGTAAAAMSVMSSVSRWARAIVGRVPLLDHEESTTLRGRSQQVDVAAPGLAAGQDDVAGEHRGELALAIRAAR